MAVKLIGAVGRAGSRPGAAGLELSLPDGATAGDLLDRLADRFGEPFRAAGARVFVEGQLARSAEQPLAGAESRKVIVMLVSPMQGGR